MTVHSHTQQAWESASQKHIREYNELLEEAKSARLLPIEETLLRDIVVDADIVHPMSGHGIDDAALIHLGAGEWTSGQLGRPRLHRQGCADLGRGSGGLAGRDAPPAAARRPPLHLRSAPPDAAVELGPRQGRGAE
jgi:hypothetical protein